MNHSIKGSVGLCFPTPVYIGKIEEPIFSQVQADFKTVFNLMKSDNMFRSPPGWDTHLISDPTFSSNFLDEYNLINFKNALDLHVKNFLKQIGSIVGDRYPVNYKIRTSWMTLTNNGQYGQTHDHAYYDIAGVYYYQTPGTDGNFYINSPLKVIPSSYCFAHMHPSITVHPEEGKIILFPGWLDHGINKNTTDSERVSVSFNITFDRQG
jgi:uncharacterized protein (TIGR02466 family)